MSARLTQVLVTLMECATLADLLAVQAGCSPPPPNSVSTDPAKSTLPALAIDLGNIAMCLHARLDDIAKAL